MFRLAALVCVAACGGATGGGAAPGWPVPGGWKTETISFPLDFAPTLAHHGVEELRFPPGFLDEHSPNHWSYAFVWRLDDAATLDDAALSAELTTYFRGLLTAVDGDKHRFDPAAIQVQVTGGAVRAHLHDAFGNAAAIDVEGTARRTSCGPGALWSFVLAPPASPVRHQLDELAAAATCSYARR